MSSRPELIRATDEYIDTAVKHADPMVLRGLLYQLTGDEDLADIELGTFVGGFAEAKVVAREEDVARIQAKAAAFLKSYRDRGAPEIGHGPAERLQKSIAFTVGDEAPDAELELWVEQLAFDPWARGLSRKLPAEKLEGFKVAVIGAGMGGLNAAVQLKRSGIPYVLIEKNADVGGTWFENQYPGARVDSPSRTYTHLYGVNFVYPYAYCPQRENLRYFNWVADHFGLREDIVLNTEVKSVVWDEAASEWVITADGPQGQRTWRANTVFTAVGFLSRPNTPVFPGQERFKGPAFHTAQWPKDLDVRDKRVAVIGTGATGYQLVAELAKHAGHVHLFQRTPSWCFDVPGYLDPFPEQVNWLDRNFPYITNFIRLRMSWMAGPQTMAGSLQIDPDFKDPHARSARNQRIRNGRIDYIHAKFGARPDLAEAMVPDTPPLATRWVIVDSNYNIYDALLRDNVTLVTDPIERFSEHAIEVAGAPPVEVDVIVFATGFKANDFLWPMEVRGKDGVHIEDLWSKDGPRAYLGAMLPGFPNFFMIYGPNTNNFGGLQIVDFQELTTRFALECIAGMIEEGKQAIDVTPEAYWRYNAEVDRCEAKMLYSDTRVETYYRNAFGRSSANCPIDVRRIWRWSLSPAPGSPARDQTSDDPLIRARFGEDLVLQ
jgi:4-hydroxyacetophenone monooxygenase